MGIDWQAFIQIYSDNETDLEIILQTISKYIKEDITEENEGYGYRTNKCITICYNPHTVGLSTERLDLHLYELSRIIVDYPSCFMEASWWADSGTIKKYVCWNENGFAKNKFISYETVDDQFYPNYQRKGESRVVKKKDEVIKDIYIIRLCFESHTEFDIESMESLLESFGVAHYKGCSNWIHANYSSNTLEFLIFYTLLQDFEDSYLKIDWHLADGTQTGKWVGYNSNNDITVQSIQYPTNPRLYKEWNSGDRISITEQIKQVYNKEKEMEPVPIPIRRRVL
jgi:hypothetical protein